MSKKTDWGAVFIAIAVPLVTLTMLTSPLWLCFLLPECNFHE